MPGQPKSNVILLVIHSAPRAEQVVAGRTSRSSAKSKSAAPGTQLQMNEPLIHTFIQDLCKPVPDHISFHTPRTNHLPARVLLHFFDTERGSAVAKTGHVGSQTICIDGCDRVVTASFSIAKDEHLRDFVLAADIFRSTSKLKRGGLIGALLSGDGRDAVARAEERGDQKTAKLEQEVGGLKDNNRRQASQLKMLHSRLAKAESKAAQKALKPTPRALSTPKARSPPAAEEAGRIHHRYRTRYSLIPDEVEGLAN